MTIDDIFKIATAGDGTLDQALAAQAGMPLEDFLAEKDRRIAMAAAEQEAQNERNRHRSTGSLEEAEPRADLGDPTAEALQYFDRMEEAYQHGPEIPLEGQEILPGFELQEEPANTAPLDAETVKRNIRRINFRLDYLKDPEDALIEWGAPHELLESYLKKQFLSIVQIAADELLADPKQIADKARRTPEQQQKLYEVSARESMARFTQFFQTRWYHAISALDGIKSRFADLCDAAQDAEEAQQEPAADDQDPLRYADLFPLEAQAALYFFAIHEDLNPTESVQLTEDQKAEVIDIFTRLDSFYCETIGHKIEDVKLKEIPGMLSAFIDQQHKKPRQKSKLAQAEEIGAITTIGERLFLPTDKEYQNAFMTSTRANIGFFRKNTAGERQLATDLISPAFMQALAKTVWQDLIKGKQGDTSVYFPAFARELGLDLNRKTNDEPENTGAQEVQDLTISRADAREMFINRMLSEWDNIWGVLPRRGRKEYKLMAMHTYDPDTEIFTFQSPYLQQLLNDLKEKEDTKLTGGDRYYYWQSDLLHASAANERNRAALEMATRILQGVQRRGTEVPDSKLPQNKGKVFADPKEISWDITCGGLIQDCVQIRERLRKQPTASRKTQELKRTFSAMYRILREKTDLFKYYRDLTITEVIPTAKSLDARIIISHHGSNTDYQRPFIPIQDIPTEENNRPEQAEE